MVARALTAHGQRLDSETETFVIKGAAVGRAPENGPQYGEVLADGTCYTLNATEQHCIAHTLRAEGADASEEGTGRGVPLAVVPFDTTQVTSDKNYSNPKFGDPCHPLAAAADAPAVAFYSTGYGDTSDELTPTLKVGSGIGLPSPPPVATAAVVRRLTPVECARLQGLPDGWLAGESDSAQYRMLGNAMAVPVITWLGHRLMEAIA